MVTKTDAYPDIAIPPGEYLADCWLGLSSMQQTVADHLFTVNFFIASPRPSRVSSNMGNIFLIILTDMLSQ